MTNTMPTPNPQLCTAQYRAEQIPGYVVITATGFHQTSGYKVFFQRSPLAVFPPEYSFWHVFPSEITLDVITPFSESVRFAAKDRVQGVKVWDATGEHNISVDSAPDFQVEHAAKCMDKDGPFP